MSVELLAAGSGAAGTAGTSSRSNGAAGWQQQLQRAQAAGWFCRSDQLPTGEATPDRSRAVDLQQRVAGGGPGSAGMGMKPASQPHVPSTFNVAKRLAPATALAPASAAAEMVVPSQVVDAARIASTMVPPGEAPAATRVARQTPRANALSEPQPAHGPAAEKPEPPAIRVHIEEGSQGLQFWLGLDGTPAEVAARAIGVAAELRRQCERAGLRLASVTCNGLPVAGDAPVPIRPREEP
jgi:hypothetical protein